jgi:hypothetical protein
MIIQKCQGTQKKALRKSKLRKGRVRGRAGDRYG